MKRLLALALIFCAPLVWATGSGTLSADGQGADTTCRTGQARVYVAGSGGNNFGSGIAKLQFKTEQGNWVDVTGATGWAADIVQKIDTGFKTTFRIDLTGSTSPTLDWGIVCRSGG